MDDHVPPPEHRSAVPPSVVLCECLDGPFAGQVVHVGVRAAFVDVPKERYDGYYNGVSNRVLWQLHHYLFDLSYLPSWDVESRQIWDDYREVNRLFAQANPLEKSDEGSLQVVDGPALRVVPIPLDVGY